MSYKEDFNLFVGTKTGILKGVISRKGKIIRVLGVKAQDGSFIVKTSQNIASLTKDHEITAMAWGGDEEKEILLGLANQTVRIYDSEFKAFSKCMETKCGEGPIVGVARCNKHVMTASASGHVKLWGSTKIDILNTGGALDRMRMNPHNRSIIATGGKSNDLKLWNVGAGNVSIFKAKNVPHNHLQLEVPVWVSDMTFLPESSKLAVCTRYGQVRLYDPTAQRRPVLNMDIPEKALISIASAPKDGHVVVGTGTGQMYLIDLRQKGMLAGHFKGITGSVREIACHRTEPYVVSVSLDRHLRIHDCDSRKLLHKEYLKSKLNCVLMRSEFSLKPAVREVGEDGTEVPSANTNLSTDVGTGSDGDDMDEIFGAMETVNEKASKKRKIIITGMDISKKKKKKIV